MKRLRTRKAAKIMYSTKKKCREQAVLLKFALHSGFCFVVPVASVGLPAFVASAGLPAFVIGLPASPDVIVHYHAPRVHGQDPEQRQHGSGQVAEVEGVIQ